MVVGPPPIAGVGIPGCWLVHDNSHIIFVAYVILGLFEAGMSPPLMIDQYACFISSALFGMTMYKGLKERKFVCFIDIRLILNFEFE